MSLQNFTRGYSMDVPWASYVLPGYMPYVIYNNMLGLVMYCPPSSSMDYDLKAYMTRLIPMNPIPGQLCAVGFGFWGLVREEHSKLVDLSKTLPFWLTQFLRPISIISLVSHTHFT